MSSHQMLQKAGIPQHRRGGSEPGCCGSTTLDGHGGLSLISNAHHDAKVVAAARTAGSSWSQLSLPGDNGAIPRQKSQASLLTADDKHQLMQFEK
ncbi:MAG: hypothetical protein HKO58_04600 [Gammaproteobacteria bacterium]|nr:hypothetical protein [Gammaproteobacteria bacterium]